MKNYTFVGKDMPVRSLAKAIKNLEEKQGYPVRLTGKYIITEEGIKFEISKEGEAIRRSLNETKRKAIEKIAKEALGIETIETRNSDELDFYDLLIGNIKKALEEAYEAGHHNGVRLTLVAAGEVEG